MRFTANIPPITDFQNVLKWFAFFHSEEGKALFAEMGKTNFDELEFEEMDQAEAQLLYILMQFSVMFLQIIQTEPEASMMFPEIGTEAFSHIAKGLIPYEKVLKHIAEGHNVSEMEDRILGKMMEDSNLNEVASLEAFKQKMKL